MFMGYLGMILLLCSYIFLYFNRYFVFYVMDSIASIMLTIHAIILKDIPFIIVNGFISLILLKKSIEVYKNGRVD